MAAERHVKVDPSTYKTNGKYTSNRGFYYDSQLEDPFLSISLHPNTYKEGDEWKVYKSDILTPTMGGDYDCYSKTPIARCIMTDDFIYSINNNWTDYNGGNAIENLFDQFKPYAPILAKGAKGLEEGLKSLMGNNYGSTLVNTANKVGKITVDLLKNGSNFLNNALMVQGTRFTYYSGSSVNFNNMELKFIAFSDWLKNGEFQSVDDYIKNLHQYVLGDYHPVGTGTGNKDLDKFIGEYVGYQSPPGGFTMDTQQITSKGLNVILKGTMRLNIGGQYAISNLIIKNMTVTLSKTRAKNPVINGGTVPLYAEITLQLGPACMIVNQGFNSIINHTGVQTDIIEPMTGIYAKELDRKKANPNIDKYVDYLKNNKWKLR